MFFLLSKRVNCDRLVALLGTQVRWWECQARVDGILEKTHPIDWDAPTKEAGEAYYTVWEAMLELELCAVETGPTPKRSSHNAQQFAEST